MVMCRYDKNGHKLFLLGEEKSAFYYAVAMQLALCLSIESLQRFEWQQTRALCRLEVDVSDHDKLRGKHELPCPSLKSFVRARR